MSEPETLRVLRPGHVLLAEDSQDDAETILEALEGDARIVSPVTVVTDGIEALAYLTRQPPYEDAPRPALVLMDLNMPRMKGGEVIARMKSDPSLRSIPVVVVTTSQAEADRAESYDLGASAYVTKRAIYSDFIGAIQGVVNFFFGIADLPQRDPPEHER